ncbi:Exported zinc metalloprotease YfgC precursor [hydrothermal vent metagenome]|uniref:Exported zinc metalloprotease YfgC n=1 Tax=hydrothermal vent metagenome TaxID=652676 RepID=A0A3B1A286_9ZZZZ
MKQKMNTLSSYLKSSLIAMRLILLCVLLFPFLSGPGQAAIDLPHLGDASGTIISPEEERRLGEAFMRELRRSVKIVDDTESNEYLQSLGQRIVSHANYRGAFTFFLVDAPSINAFAAPGGYIGIHTGLVLATQSESELASVIAHEIAHITQRHLPRAFEQASKLSLPTAAALIAALILGQGSSQATEAVLATALAGTQQSQINFTRANEKEADRIGMQLLTDSGFDPKGMPQFFSRLQQAYRFYENNLPEFLRTHPVTLSRISDSTNRAAQYPPFKGKTLTNYAFFQARLRILSNPSSSNNINYFKAKIKDQNDPKSLAARYGYTLGLIQSGKLKKALIEAQNLVNHDKENIVFILLKSQILLLQTKHQAAIEQLQEALLLYPKHNALTSYYGQALIKNKDHEEARQVLQSQLHYTKKDPNLHKLYARAASGAGYPADSHQALSEYYYLIGETSTAIQQLQLALNLIKKKNFYQSVRINARIRDLKKELQESLERKH